MKNKSAYYILKIYNINNSKSQKMAESTIKTIYFITGNKNKAREVANKLKLCKNIKIEIIKLDLQEIQGDCKSICKAKCLEATKYVDGPILVEDTSLCFNALGGLPGPYIKWFLEKLKPIGLFKMLSSFGDKTGYAMCTLAYYEKNNDKILFFEGKCVGKIIEPRKESDFGWDSIFLPENSVKTFSEIEPEIKNEISHRAKALEKFLEYFEKGENN
ncbi:Non-canonical purine NTP pyrophosphatase [Nucleospora cyclopteri]